MTGLQALEACIHTPLSKLWNEATILDDQTACQLTLPMERFDDDAQSVHSFMESPRV